MCGLRELVLGRGQTCGAAGPALRWGCWARSPARSLGISFPPLRFRFVPWFNDKWLPTTELTSGRVKASLFNPGLPGLHCQYCSGCLGKVALCAHSCRRPGSGSRGHQPRTSSPESATKSVGPVPSIVFARVPPSSRFFSPPGSWQSP